MARAQNRATKMMHYIQPLFTSTRFAEFIIYHLINGLLPDDFTQFITTWILPTVFHCTTTVERTHMLFQLLYLYIIFMMHFQIILCHGMVLNDFRYFRQKLILFLYYLCHSHEYILYYIF